MFVELVYLKSDSHGKFSSKVIRRLSIKSGIDQSHNLAFNNLKRGNYILRITGYFSEKDKSLTFFGYSLKQKSKIINLAAQFSPVINGKVFQIGKTAKIGAQVNINDDKKYRLSYSIVSSSGNKKQTGVLANFTKAGIFSIFTKFIPEENDFYIVNYYLKEIDSPQNPPFSSSDAPPPR